MSSTPTRCSRCSTPNSNETKAPLSDQPIRLHRAPPPPNGGGVFVRALRDAPRDVERARLGAGPDRTRVGRVAEFVAVRALGAASRPEHEAAAQIVDRIDDANDFAGALGPDTRVSFLGSGDSEFALRAQFQLLF